MIPKLQKVNGLGLDGRNKGTAALVGTGMATIESPACRPAGRTLISFISTNPMDVVQI